MDTTTYDEPQRLYSLKRTAYLLVLSVGIAAVVISRVLEDAIDPFERVLLPVIAGWLAIALVVTLLTTPDRRPTIRFVEIFCHTGIALFFLAKLAYLLFVTYPEANIVYEFLESSVWVLSVYMIAFLIYDTQQGARWSLGYYALFVGLGLYKFMQLRGTGVTVAEFGAIIQYYISTGAFIGILFTFGRIKAAYIRADVEARVSKRLAHTDFLTKLPNRRQMMDLLQKEVERSNRYNRTFSIMLLDLDQFKRVNDNYGHDVGDAVLQEVATLLEENLRTVDHVSRWGGEEFLIIAPEVTLDQAVQQAERLRRLLAGYTHDEVGTVTASFGAARYRRGETVNELLRRADMALFRAKEHGRNQVARAA